MPPTNRSADVDWLLDDLLQRVPEAVAAVVLSADGLLVGASKSLGREDAEHLAAMASGFQSLARSASRHFHCGGVRQTVVEMDTAFLFITAAGTGACLAVLSEAESDIGLIAYEMAMLVTRVGPSMSVASRGDTVATDAPR